MPAVTHAEKNWNLAKSVTVESGVIWQLPRWQTEIEAFSLDHDLGDDERGTGYDVILWIEEAVALRGFRPPKILVHSANSSARNKMLSGVAAIERLVAKRVL
ncbi:UNVERIFIED_ORG: hypothetical protein BDU10_2560 [Burkholderia sp. CF145]